MGRFGLMLGAVALAFGGGLLAQESEQAKDAPPPVAMTDDTKSDTESSEDVEDQLVPVKKNAGVRRFSFADFSYRYFHEDGRPSPASYHEFELTLGGGQTAGPNGPGLFVGLNGRGRASQGNSGRRNEGASLSLVFGGLGVMPDKKAVEDSEDGDELARNQWTRSGRFQFELGVSHISRFEVGAPPNTGVGNLDGKTGFRWSILAEQQIIGPIHGRAQYGYEYYGDSANLMELTWTLHVPFKLFDGGSLMAGHRTHRARGYKRTMIFVGVELAF